jgi:hypothetical protein
MKKSSKKPILLASHPATKFLNFVFSGSFKPLCEWQEDLYEELHELHLKNKEYRGEVSYLTYKEILNFILEKNPKAFETYRKDAVEIAAAHFAAVLNWKQFKQIYKFQPQLLEELWNIDFTDERYETLSMTELQFLPCYSFFVEVPMSFNNEDYVGFFAYFDMHTLLENTYVIHIQFITDTKYHYFNGQKSPIYDCFNLSLSYDYDIVTIKARDTDEIIQAKVDTKEILKAMNPHVFKDLGEEKALEIIIKVNQIITYLACSNADFTLVKKPTRKPDIKRTTITDLEHTEYRLGDTYARLASGKEVNRRYLGDAPDAYTKSEEVEVSENDTEREVGYRRTGYHMRPHMRKAHWSTYWYGKKDGSEERVKRRKFVSAVFINQTGEEIEMPTREIVKLRF